MSLRGVARTLGVAVAWVLAALGAKFIDQPLSDWLAQPPRGPWLRGWLDSLAGLMVYVGVPSILLALPNWKRLFLSWNAAMLLSALLTHALKWAVGRARPHQALGAFTYEPFSQTDHMNSFPSGHTSSAVTIALLLGLYFPRLRGVFWFFAAVVALERIVTRNHYPSDVIAGAGIGVLAVLVAWRGLGPAWFAWHEPPRAELDAAGSAPTIDSFNESRGRT